MLREDALVGVYGGVDARRDLRLDRSERGAAASVRKHAEVCKGFFDRHRSWALVHDRVNKVDARCVEPLREREVALFEGQT